MYLAFFFVFFPHQSLIFDEVDLSDASVAETSTKNINNSFTVKTSEMSQMWFKAFQTCKFALDFNGKL